MIFLRRSSLTGCRPRGEAFLNGVSLYAMAYGDIRLITISENIPKTVSFKASF